MANQPMMKFAPLIALALLSGTPALAAASLTVAPGESWVFSIKSGEPVRARRVKPGAKPASGQIKVTVIAGLGTSMTVTNYSRTAYTFRAELIGAPSAPKARTCTLPASRNPVLEYWPVKAKAVRLSRFRVAATAGSCP